MTSKFKQSLWFLQKNTKRLWVLKSNGTKGDPRILKQGEDTWKKQKETQPKQDTLFHNKLELRIGVFVWPRTRTKSQGALPGTQYYRGGTTE